MYAGGSYALGDYVPGRSDLDVAAVSARSVDDGVKAQLVEALRHESLPCPARGLEFVLYTRRAAGAPGAGAAYELDLNTGPAMPFRASFDSAEADPHWYAIDRAILAQHGRRLHGPPAAGVFGAPPRDELIAVLAESLRWHAAAVGGEARGDDAVLNACRALLYAREGRWASKATAGDWARGLVADAGLVGLALEARGSGAPLPADRVRAFLVATEAALESGKEPAPGR